MAKRLRAAPVVLAFAVATVLGSCSWSAREPGLFTTPRPSVAPSSGPSGSTASAAVPPPTDPRLPVVGDALWTTAEGNDVDVRFAVHAVRRTSAATVLDWSVTPLAGPGRRPGEALPSGTDLGLDQSVAGQQNLALLDPRGDLAYRPLANLSPDLFHHCLCTPLFAVLPRLRFGETRLLQIAFPPLPASTTRVDVTLPDLAVVTGVAVTPVGAVPVVRAPTDLARPAVSGDSVTGAKLYAVPDGSRDLQTVVVNRVVASRALTTIAWTLYSVDDQDTRTRAAPPVAAPLPAGVRVATQVPASGPRLRIPGSAAAPTGVRWTTATENGLPAYECLCSGLGLWSRGLRVAGGSAHLNSQVGPLPRGTRRVDVLFPGLTPFTDVPVSWDDGADGPLPAAVPGTDATWTYDETDPPRGWSTQEWPTPLPAPAQVPAYASRPEQVLAALPGT